MPSRKRGYRRFLKPSLKHHRLYGTTKVVRSKAKPLVDAVNNLPCSTLALQVVNNLLHECSTLLQHCYDAMPAQKEGPGNAKTSGFSSLTEHGGDPLACSDNVESSTTQSRVVDASIEDIVMKPSRSLRECSVSLVDCVAFPQLQEEKPAPRVLSLFDGISSGLVALKNLNIDVHKYYSSEIDRDALKVQRFNFKEEVIRLGTVRRLSNKKIAQLGRIDLLLGGSPCEDISLANPNRRGLTSPKGTAKLFFDYVRILKFLSKAAKENGHQFYWLFENTFSMEAATLKAMSRALNCEPVMICASKYTAMKRRRYFWGNLPSLAALRHNHSTSGNQDLQLYLEPYRVAVVKVLPTITTSAASQRSGVDRVLPVIEDEYGTKEFVGSKLFITELERVFGFIKHFTDAANLSITAREKLLGRSWCIQVIEAILRPLLEMYRVSN